MLMALSAGAGTHAARSRSLKLATWNMDWLTTRPVGDPSLPPDVGRRSADDFHHLADDARRLNADIVGLQEIDGDDVARRIFPPDRYALLLTTASLPQRVGLAVRKGLMVERHPDIEALNVAMPGDPHQLRAGLDATVIDDGVRLRLLVVHLKTGCWDAPMGERGHSCPILERQIRIVADWILERQDEGEAYAVMGDFNRRLTLHDPEWAVLSADAPMTLTTAGRASPCWGGEYFIDHILLGNAARDWLVPDSLRVMLYGGPSGQSVDERAHLSDHCPVSVRLSPSGIQSPATSQAD